MTPLLSKVSGAVDNVASYGIGQYGKGNIDLYNRPQHKNEDGSVSTVRSIGFNIDGKELVLPTIAQDGSLLSDMESLDYYKKTGQYLGKFDTEKQSNRYSQRLHLQQARLYPNNGGGSIWQ